MLSPSLRHVTVAILALSLGTIATSRQGVAEEAASFPSPEQLLHAPVGSTFPGGVSFPPPIKDPEADDPAAAQRGMQAFLDMNCVGCHAPNGGGGMGPALSERTFIYGREPANIYLSIQQGRPHGMPAWAKMLPANVTWDLVAYIRSISNAPETEWGQTTSRSPQSPTIQQVPAGMLTTTTPWAHTEPFGNGREPPAMH